MNDSRLWRLKGVCGLNAVALWLCIFPMYLAGENPPASVYDGTANAEFLFKIRSFVFTGILFSLLYVVLMVFAVGFRDLIRRVDSHYKRGGTLLAATMGIWLGVSTVANGMESGADLDTLAGNAEPSVISALTEVVLLIYNGAASVTTGLFSGTAGYAAFITGILPRWTGRMLLPRSVRFPFRQFMSQGLTT